ncbi:MAG: hypothetical protein ACE5NM_08035 [Sedimentisphaerales bacterium]
MGIFLLVVNCLAVRIDYEQQQVFRNDKLFDGLGAVVSPDGLSCRSVDGAERLVDAQRRVNLIADSDEAARQSRRAALQRKEMIEPLRQRALPQDDTTEGVSGSQHEFCWQLDRLSRAFVYDVEYPPVGRDQSVKTG